jgi:DNA-binding NarL/FixJ family response regulator
LSKRILIADDHESVLRRLRSLLTKPGWEICGDAVDGNEAVARAIELRPDVIILDLVMPRMNGLKAAEAIRTVLPAAPIVINTLYRTPQVEVEAKKHGIRKVVDKGNVAALISAVEELLDAA